MCKGENNKGRGRDMAADGDNKGEVVRGGNVDG
jgi:hypothetical protein